MENPDRINHHVRQLPIFGTKPTEPVIDPTTRTPGDAAAAAGAGGGGGGQADVTAATTSSAASPTNGSVAEDEALVTSVQMTSLAMEQNATEAAQGGVMRSGTPPQAMATTSTGQDGIIIGSNATMYDDTTEEGATTVQTVSAPPTLPATTDAAQAVTSVSSPPPDSQQQPVTLPPPVTTATNTLPATTAAITVPPPPAAPTTPRPLPNDNRLPALPPKDKVTTCSSYDAFAARLACHTTRAVEAHPLSWTGAMFLLILICYCRFCRGRGSAGDVNARGEYRAIAASMTDEAFGDDISFGENEEYLSDDEEYGNGSIQMSSLDKDGGLALNELNG